MHVVGCDTGVARHAPDLGSAVISAGGTFSTVECFDKCEACEKELLVRIEGAMLRCSGAAEVVEALRILGQT